MRKFLLSLHRLLVVGLLIASVITLAACGTYGSPRYPDGKSPLFSTAPSAKSVNS